MAFHMDILVEKKGKKKKSIFGKYFHLITKAEHHEHFEKLTVDFHS